MNDLILPFWMISCKGLNSSEKLVLASITYLNQDNITGILLGDIMELLGISRPTLRKTLERLKEKDVIKVIRKSDGSIYQILWENLCRKVFLLSEKEIKEYAEIIPKMNHFFFLPDGAKYGKVTLQKDPSVGAKYDKLTLSFNTSKDSNINIDYLVSTFLLLLRNKRKVETRLSRLAPRSAGSPKLLRRDKVDNSWYDNLIKPKDPLPKRNPPASVPNKVKAIIEYWKFCGLKVPRDTSKAYRLDIAAIKRLLSGKLFSGEDHRKYTTYEIKQSITDFSGAALDDRFEPVDKEIKKRLAGYYLHTFIENTYAVKQSGYSMFLKYLKEPPREVMTLIKDPYPAVTEIIRKFYYKRIVGKKPKEVPPNIENCFRKATKRLLEFIRSKDIRACMFESPAESARMLCDCTLKRAGKDPSIITPGWFCSDYTFENALPAYFKAQGMYEEQMESSIYNRQEDIGEY